MKTIVVEDVTAVKYDANDGRLTGVVKRAIFRRLSKIRYGRIILQHAGRQQIFGHCTAVCSLEVNITVEDARFFTCIATGGSVGAGEAYIHGYWSCDDLTALIRIMTLNRPVLQNLGGGLAWLLKPVKLARHFLRRNTLTGSKDNIRAHYDIGNDLFSLFLDESMMYSAAIYPRSDSSLEEAARYKIDLICRKLQLRADDHLLEIGTGWGALAMHAAAYYGCKVTSTTISDEQFRSAVERVQAAGLENRISIIKRDYRQLAGNYDKLVSVEMLEAVGQQYLDTFFKKCSALLKPDGLMLLQTITIADQFYDYTRKSVDFIQRFIFPGGSLPSIGAISGCIARATDFRLLHLADFGDHYARTLHDWRQRFFTQLTKVRELGYPDSFIRLWEYYLCYCEGGFLEKTIGVSQWLLAKPLNRGVSVPVRW